MENKGFLHKDELLQEAMTEFADKGFDSASLNQIIKRSGISKGSFYHHFNNKEELFLKVVDGLPMKNWLLSAADRRKRCGQ